MKDPRYSRKAAKFRKFFIVSAIGMSFSTSMLDVGGIFMTSYLVYLGVAAPQIGFLAALPNLTNIIQVFSILVYRKFRSRKKVLIALRALKYLFLYFIIAVPRLVTGEMQFGVIAACFFFGHMFRALSGSGDLDWNNMFVPPEIKGRHFSKRNLIGNASYIIISLTLGRILDFYDKSYMIYLAILGVTFIFVFVELIMYSAIDDCTEGLEGENPQSFAKMVRMPMKNGPYRAFILFSLAWMFARSLATPYYTYYSKTVLALDYTYIAILGSSIAILKIFMAGVWGGTGDKKGWRRILAFSGYAFAAANMTWAFINPDTVFLYPLAIISTGIFMIGANITIFNLNFELSPEEDRMLYFGFRAAAIGIFSFIAPNLAGWMVGLITPVDIRLLGFSINGYQMVFMLSALLQIVAVRQFVVYLKRKKLGERHL
ncbi:MAG: MFS transporter [Clostridia bacterium]|nr:MFS transporter [Clostridia bacterium]